jgi:uncharacterized surface protein with fasciclin (FAS1) repeats
MKRSTLVLVCSVALAACQGASENEAAPTNTATTNSALEVSKESLADQIGKSPDLSRFADALKAAGLDKTLAGPGPYTVFAPTNAAFDKLPPGTADGLLQSAQKAQLTELLTAHIVPGAVTAEDLAKAVESGGGKVQLATIGGGPITITRDGDALAVTDSGGGEARIVRADGLQSNGALHAIDGVLQPAG